MVRNKFHQEKILWIAALTLLLIYNFSWSYCEYNCKIVKKKISFILASYSSSYRETHWIDPLWLGSVVEAVIWSILGGQPVAEGNGDSPSAQTGLGEAPLWSCRHEPSGERGRVWLMQQYQGLIQDLSITGSSGGWDQLHSSTYVLSSVYMYMYTFSRG